MRFLKNMIRLNELYDKLDKNQSKIEVQLEELDQYGRRENLEVHGIPWSQNENTNAIVKKVTESLKVKLDDKDISTSHRLHPNNKLIGNRPSKRQNPDQFAYKNSTQTKAELRDVAAVPQTPQLGGPRPTLGAQVSLKLLFGYVTIFSSADLFTTDLNCRKKLACDIISECYVILSRRILNNRLT